MSKAEQMRRVRSNWGSQFPGARTIRRAAGVPWVQFLLTSVLLGGVLFPAWAGAVVVLDQESLDQGPASALIGFSNSLTRAQTFTVGVKGTLDGIEVFVSGTATTTFEIHPTTGGLPVFGSAALASTVVSFDSPSLDPPIAVPVDFSSAGIQVEVGDLLAIVQPGGTSMATANTPFWHTLNSANRYEGGASFTTTGPTPNDYIEFGPRDNLFRTYVDAAPAASGTLPFDPDDRTDRAVHLYSESTTCLTTGTSGLADPSCTVHAGGQGAVFANGPLLANLVWSGDIATLTLPPAATATFLTEELGAAPTANSALTLRFDAVTGAIVGGVLSGASGDLFLDADLPTPQGTLAFEWLNRSQFDRPFEGTVLVGTAFEKQVVASCATESDAGPPAVVNGICFLQQDQSPGFDPISSTLTAFAQLNATFPIEDYSPEYTTLDFGIAELPPAPSVPSLSPTASALLLLGLIGIGLLKRNGGPVGGRPAARPRLMGLALALLWPTMSIVSGTANAETFEGVLEIGIAETFSGVGEEPATATWHRTLNTGADRISLPPTNDMPGFRHGDRVRVSGTIVADVLEPESVSELATPPSSALRMSAVPSTETLGAQSTLVTLLNFTNDLSQPTDSIEMTTLLLDESEPMSAASFFREASYDRAWLSGGVAGWLPVGYDDTNCEMWTSTGFQDLIEAMDPLLNFASIDRWVILIPPNSNCGFAGFSSLGKEEWSTDDGLVRFSRFYLNGFSTATGRVAIHEFGHSVGALQHAVDYECGPDVVADECAPGPTGTHRYDPMSTGVPSAHFSAPNKDALHWFDTDLVEVTGAGGTYLLEPYASSTGGTKALRIPVDWRIDDLRGTNDYYVTYRTPLGFDAGFGELATDGAILSMDGDFFQLGDPPATGAVLLLDTSPGSGATQVTDTDDVMIGIGETFVDSTHTISIEVLGVVGGALEVNVTIASYCGDGLVDPSLGESCDSTDLAGATCESIGWTSGALSCNASCGYDTVACSEPRCGPGHSFDSANQTCTAEVLLDDSTRNMWLSRADWTDLREATFGKILNPFGHLFLLNFQRSDFNWIYRDSLPFDTSSIPDSASLVSASLDMKVLRTSFPYTNSHPDSADQLVLVQPMLTNPPIAEGPDFPFFGSTNNPVEGAGRVDMGDVEGPQDFNIQFALNATGLGWIDTLGMTYLGLRGGYDVDDVTIPGEEPKLEVYFRSEASPHAGPRLTVVYNAVPEPGMTIGLILGVGGLVALQRRRFLPRS